MWISIHTPTKGATAEAEQGLQWLLYFNPHSHEGSDPLSMTLLFVSIHISIHTPTKGATRAESNSEVSGPISIHTPTKGATQSDILGETEQPNFNPHSHEGSDRPFSWLYGSSLYFNPHSHEGSDYMAEKRCLYMARFQSTLPRRERRGRAYHTRAST